MIFLATFTPAWVLGDEPAAIIMDNAATHRAAGAKLADVVCSLRQVPYAGAVLAVPQSD